MPMRIAMIEKNASGDSQPLRLTEASVCPAILNSTPYHLKKLKISRTTPEMAMVISPGVSFFRSKGASVRGFVPRTRAHRLEAHHESTLISRILHHRPWPEVRVSSRPVAERRRL